MQKDVTHGAVARVLEHATASLRKVPAVVLAGAPMGATALARLARGRAMDRCVR